MKIKNVRLVKALVLGLFVFAAALVVSCGPVAPYRVSGYFVSKNLDQYNETTVAVLPFKGGASSIVTDIANLEFGRIGRWVLVERVRVEALYSEQDFDPERLDDATAAKIGLMLGAQAVVLGEVYEYSRGRSSISMRLVDTETGQQLWQARDAIEALNISVQELAKDRYDRGRLKKDPEALASVNTRALVETINR
ncbi:MAG: hypothetical protein JKX97_03105 [Candidatus Lindowbacteria bacterium]|nr:hypothetical protein [Candidatus Lindowbacteria bacterium]